LLIINLIQIFNLFILINLLFFLKIIEHTFKC